VQSCIGTKQSPPAVASPDIAVEFPAMPSLFRFLTVVAVIVGVAYGAMFALANFVTPKPREMTLTIQPDKFLKK
jgi:hypothetical protein